MQPQVQNAFLPIRKALVLNALADTGIQTILTHIGEAAPVLRTATMISSGRIWEARRPGQRATADYTNDTETKRRIIAGRGRCRTVSI